MSRRAKMGWSVKLRGRLALAAAMAGLFCFFQSAAWLPIAYGAEAKPADVAADPPAEPKLGSQLTDEEVIAYINAMLRRAWAENEITPSAQATEGEWCRRVYLDLIGRIPSVQELKAFLADKSRDKKRKLVERLLESDEYVEEYARNWTTIWTNLLIGRPRANRDDENRMVNREGMQQYLRRSFLENKPYSRLVYELVSATGSNTPGEPDYNGAVNFLLDNTQEEFATATAKVARYFLGLQVQCTQCHNHPFNEWKQDQFWGLNAFFRQTRPLRTMRGNEILSVRLENEDFPGIGGNPEDAEIYYELRNGELRVAYPTFVDGTRISPVGYISEVNRRDELAKLIVASEWLGKAIVNRMWAHFLGYGFTKPIDDFGPHNQPSHPELLEFLGKAFASTGHDLKRLMRWCVLNDAYGLSSKLSAKNGKDDPTLGVKPLFSRFYIRQMQAEQLYESLLVATEAHKSNRGSYEEQERTKGEWLSQFTLAFGTDEGDETTTFNGTIPQALMMWNGELMQRATSLEEGTFLHRIATGTMKNSAKIEYLYLAALARRPNAAEIKLANELLAARGGDAAAALQDIWWAVLNSNEFILNH